MNFRLTSAAVTGAVTDVPCGTASVMYGSDSLRKYTGPYQTRPPRVSRKRGSPETSAPPATTSMARRDMRSCSRPRPSRKATSVIGGTCRSKRDRKSTRLNSSHVEISYAVFCLKKKKKKNGPAQRGIQTPNKIERTIPKQHI